VTTPVRTTRKRAHTAEPPVELGGPMATRQGTLAVLCERIFGALARGSSLVKSFTGALGHARLGHWHPRSCRYVFLA
jgi:hypothetical protein